MDEMSETLTAPSGNPIAHAAVHKKMLRKPRGQGASRRGEILDAAKRLFIEDGFGNATMRRIAAEVGVSPTALYLHFADKEAILQAIADDYFSELLVHLQTTQTIEVPPLARLRRGLRAYLEFGLSRIDEYRLTFQSRVIRAGSQVCPENDVADLSFAVLEHAVQELVATGVFRAGDPVLIAETIWCCLHGLTSALIDLTDRVSSVQDGLIDSVIDTVVTGLACEKVAAD
jgi:AcrR family transcriptional regulator